MSKAYLDASNPIVDVLDFVYTKDHQLVIEKVGTRDIQQEIQSCADTCGMDFVLKCLSNGDTSCLVAGGTGSYGDFTDAPQSLAQVQALQESAQESKKLLPDEIKNGRTDEEILQLTADQLTQFINDAVNKKLASTETEVVSNE